MGGPVRVTVRARWLPASATSDAARLLGGRALRGFADGLVSVLLADHLTGLGFSPFEVSAVVTGTLLGSAALTLAVGLAAHRLAPRSVLLAACALMLATGLGFARLTGFWPILLLAVVGTLNPSAGDVSLFLPVEQSLLSANVADAERTALFARFNLGAIFLGALGALATGVPALAHGGRGFLVYAGAAGAIAILYLPLRSGHQPASEAGRAVPLRRSRAIVLRLTALFSLDSFGGGFVVDSLVALWLSRRFALSLPVIGGVFFAARVLAALSQLASSRLAARIGLIRTMVYTHLPANVLLIAAALVPTAPQAVACLLGRMALSQMDVPARQSYVMAVVPLEERAAAASVTNVPRSLASALTPLLAGALLARTSFGWPLVLGGIIKIAYDLLLLAQFRSVPPMAQGSTP